MRLRRYHFIQEATGEGNSWGNIDYVAADRKSDIQRIRCYWFTYSKKHQLTLAQIRQALGSSIEVLEVIPAQLDSEADFFRVILVSEIVWQK